MNHIYLLAQQVERWNQNGGMKRLEKDTREKYEMIQNFVDASEKFSFFVQDERHQSIFTSCIQADSETIKKVHEVCKENQIILGMGYGKLKKDTFRIANFPAIERSHIEKLMALLKEL